LDTSVFFIKGHIKTVFRKVEAVLEVLIAVLVPIFAASLTASITHWFATKREEQAKRQKIIGWLTWLSLFLRQIEEVQKEDPKGILKIDPKKDKILWWATQTFLTIGDSLYLMEKSTFEKLIQLVNYCIMDYALTISEYNPKAIQKIKEQVDDLIKDIKGH
jgi:hypothetical protein